MADGDDDTRISAGAMAVRPVLFVQLFMLFVDAAINTAAPLLYTYNTVLLMLYVYVRARALPNSWQCRLQNVATLMALIIMLLTFFSTYVFQAGLIGTLVRRFQATIYIALLYLAISIVYHATSLVRRIVCARRVV
jgi:hypothetical protein